MTQGINHLDIPRAILSVGNITHYHHAAVALSKAGYLKRYLYSFGYVHANETWVKLLPPYWRKKMMGRRLDKCLDAAAQFSPFSEIFARGLVNLDVISRERGNWIFGELYDLAMLPRVEGGNIFHFVSTVGLYGARKAKKNGNILICDLRSAHPDVEWSLLGEEYDVLGLDYQFVGKLSEKRIKEEFSLADYFIVPSDYVAETLIASDFDPRKIFVIPYGVDINRFANERHRNNHRHTSSNDSFNLLFVGQIGPRKGVHYLLEAFSNLRIHNSKLILVGGVEDGFQDYFMNRVRKDQRIQYVGFVPHAQLHNYYQQASVFILPSLSEGSALVIYEAMAEGLPVVTTPNAGSIISNLMDGLIIPIRNVDAILSSLIWLHNHPRESLEIGQNAARSVNNYTWDIYGSRLVDLYQRINSQKV